MKIQILVILIFISQPLFSQDFLHCKDYPFNNQQFFIKGVPQSDTLNFSDIEKGFELSTIDTSYKIIQFVIGFGCEYSERMIKGNRTLKPYWITQLKNDNIFAITCILVRKGKLIFQLKEKLFHIRELRPCP